MVIRLFEMFNIQENEVSSFPENPELRKKISELVLEFGLGHVLDHMSKELANPSQYGMEPEREFSKKLQKLANQLGKEEENF